MKTNPSSFTTRTPEDLKRVRVLLKEIGNDGHTIWPVEVLAAFPPELQRRFVETHLSSATDPTRAIYKNGKVVDQLKGVYGLHILFALAQDLSVHYKDALGRGTQARYLTEALNKHLEKL